MSAALRLDLAYTTAPITLRKLINYKASQFLFKQGEHTLFAYKNVLQHLVPEPSLIFVQQISITIQTTKLFLASISKEPLMHQLGVVKAYKHMVCSELTVLLQQIALLDSYVANIGKNHLIESQRLLNTFKEENSEIPTSAVVVSLHKLPALQQAKSPDSVLPQLDEELIPDEINLSEHNPVHQASAMIMHTKLPKIGQSTEDVNRECLDSFITCIAQYILTLKTRKKSCTLFSENPTETQAKLDAAKNLQSVLLGMRENNHESKEMQYIDFKAEIYKRGTLSKMCADYADLITVIERKQLSAQFVELKIAHQ